MDVFFYLSKNLENLWRKRFPNSGDYKKWVIEKFLEDVNENWGVEDYKREIESKELIIKKEEIEMSKLKTKLVQKEQEQNQNQNDNSLKEKEEKNSQKEYEKQKRQKLEAWIIYYFENVSRSIAKSLSKEFYNMPPDKRFSIKEFVEKKGFKFKSETFKKNPFLHKEIITR